MMKNSRLTKALLISASLLAVFANNSLQALHEEGHYTGTKSVRVRSLTESCTPSNDEVTPTRSPAPTPSQRSDEFLSEEDNVFHTLASTVGTWVLDTTASTARILFDGVVDTTKQAACILFDAAVGTTENVTHALFDGTVSTTKKAVTFVFKATTSAAKAVISSSFEYGVTAVNKGARSAFNYLNSGRIIR